MVENLDLNGVSVASLVHGATQAVPLNLRLVFTNNINRAIQAGYQIESGTVCVNGAGSYNPDAGSNELSHTDLPTRVR